MNSTLLTTCDVSAASEATQNAKQASSVQSPGSKAPFGSRFLTEKSDVWTQNAWDHVSPPDDQAEHILQSLEMQRLAPVPDADKPKYNEKPAKHWDNFYKTNESNFFKDRKWLHLEFPELLQTAQPDAGPKTVVEVGCGAGNAVFPLLSASSNPDLTLHAFDYSSHAVRLVQRNPLYLDPPIGTINAAVWDLSSPHSLPPGITPGTVDIVVLVFVLSALHPDEWGRAISNLHKMLRPGGLVLLRDYGRHDMAQLRFKKNRLLDENFYIRGDNTRVYFFELDELALLFTGSKVVSHQRTTETVLEELVEDEQIFQSSPPPVTNETDPSTSHAPSSPSIPASAFTSSSIVPTTIHPNLLSPLIDCPTHPLFSIEQLGVDRRLQVNRKRQLKMYRVWMQGKFRKLDIPS